MLSGMSGALKNQFGCIHNPNKMHLDKCDPYIAEVNALPAIRRKQRLIVMDALRPVVDNGPSYQPGMAEVANALLFAVDPVAMDVVGLELLEDLRRKRGLPSLAKVDLAPTHIQTSAQDGPGRGRSRSHRGGVNRGLSMDFSRRDFVRGCARNGLRIGGGRIVGRLGLLASAAGARGRDAPAAPGAFLEEAGQQARAVPALPQAMPGRGSRARLLRRAREPRRRVRDPGVGPALRRARGSDREEAALSLSARQPRLFASPPRVATWNASVARTGTSRSRGPRRWTGTGCHPRKSCAGRRRKAPV